jgi:hypothetical protein
MPYLLPPVEPDDEEVVVYYCAVHAREHGYWSEEEGE